MSIRIHPSWLDRILDLVERNRGADGVGASGELPDPRHDGPQWDYNHEFWLEQLRGETGGSWTEEQYADAARLLNYADQRRAILYEVQKLVAEHRDAGDGSLPHGLDSGILGLIEQAGDQFAFALTPASEAIFSPDPDHVGRAEAAADAGGGTAVTGQGGASDATGARPREPSSGVFAPVRADLAVQAVISAFRQDGSAALLEEPAAAPLVIEIRAAPEAPAAAVVADTWAMGLPTMPELGVTLAALARDSSGAVARLAPAEELATSMASAPAAITVPDWTRGGGQSAAVRDLDGPPIDHATARAEGGDLRLTGGDGNDKLIGGAGDDVISGGAGDDTLEGGDGDDVISGGAGKDKIIGGRGADRISAGSGDDVVSGGAGNDVVSGGTGDDLLAGDEGDDVLKGEAGDDALSGGSGNDDLEGGVGNDHLAGDVGDDQLHGGRGADLVEGGAGDDTLSGNGPSDQGDGAADLLIGGLGNDTIYIEEAGDVAVEQADEGTDTVATSLNVYVLPDNVEILIFVGTGGFDARGNEGANIIIGAAGDDVLEGAGGADVLEGGLGNDVYRLDEAGDIVVELAAAGVDVVETVAGTAILAENVEVLIYTGGNAFTGTGNELDNVIVGGDLGDVLEGLKGDDELYGGLGNDTLYGGDGDDRIDGGDGDDVVLAGGGSDFVLFTRGHDTLLLMPGFGNDVVLGFDTDSSGEGSRDQIDVSAFGISEESFGTDILLVYDGEATVVRIGLDSVRLLQVDIDSVDSSTFIFS